MYICINVYMYSSPQGYVVTCIYVHKGTEPYDKTSITSPDNMNCQEKCQVIKGYTPRHGVQ